MGTTYILQAPKVRVHRPGQADYVVERPRNKDTLEFLDTKKPTLITLEEGDQVDVQDWLRTGVIAPYQPPAPPKAIEASTGKAPWPGKEDTDGEAQ